MRHLYQNFLPPWKRVIDQVDTIMEDYTEIDGVPNVANRFTLNKLLRKELAFDGVLVTDFHEIFNLYEWHHTASNRTDAMKKALEEGSVDMSMIATDPDDYFQAMKSFESNSQFASRIKKSARRVLELKQKLNMFEEAFSMQNSSTTDDDKGPTKAELNQALDMTAQSIVLAQNNDNALPLDTTESLKVLVTGPTSRSLSFQTGGWSGTWQGVDSQKEDEWFTYGSTVFDSIIMKRGENWQVSFSCGTDILGQDCQEDESLEATDENETDDGIMGTIKGVGEDIKGWVGSWKDDGDDLSIERAMTKAQHMDVIVVCIGEESYAEKPGDIRSLELPAGQYELIAGLRQVAPEAKIVAIYFGGRPRLLRDVVVSHMFTSHFKFSYT